MQKYAPTHKPQGELCDFLKNRVLCVLLLMHVFKHVGYNVLGGCMRCLGCHWQLQSCYVVIGRFFVERGEEEEKEEEEEDEEEKDEEEAEEEEEEDDEEQK